MTMHPLTSRFLIAGLCALLIACSEPVEPAKTVSLTGTVVAPEGVPAGPVTIRLFHAWALDGILRHPRAELETFTVDGKTFSHTFEYPIEKGEGLLVFASMDADGDGAHCAPDSRIDPAGMAIIENQPGDSVDVTIELTELCAGPDFFYPPVPETGS